MARWRSAVFPLSQIASAGIALALWLVIGELANSSVRQIAISSYAFGVPGSLVASLGISYVLPNTFRSTAVGQRRGGGPWSKPLRVALGVSALISAGGAILSFVPDASYRVHVVAASLAVAGTIATGVTVAQVGRTTDRLGLAMLGQFMVPAVAAIWLTSYYISDSDVQQIRLSCTLMLGCAALLASLLVPYLRRCERGDDEDLNRLFRAAGILLPHLLLFGILMQGVRIIAVIDGSSSDEVGDAHNLMLAVSVGYTLLASINSYVAPRLQAVREDEYSEELSKALKVYAVAGVAGVICVWTTIGLFSLGSFLSEIDLATYVFVAASLIAIAAYYSMSAQFMRILRTAPLTMASAVGVLTLTIPVAVGAQLTFDRSVSNMAAAALTLLVVMTMFSYFEKNANIRRSIWLPAALAAAWGATFAFLG